MSLILCPKCKKIINTVYYPRHWKDPRPDCVKCRYKDATTKEEKNKIANQAIMGLARNQEEAEERLSHVKEHYDAAPIFDPKKHRVDEHGDVHYLKGEHNG